MEKTTGELSLTVVTIAAIVLLSGFVALLWDGTIKPWIETQFGGLTGDNGGDGGDGGDGGAYLEIADYEVNM